MTFSEVLLQERKRRGLSQEELAGMVNVSRQAVSKWETGDAMPDLPKLLALADALDISLDALCGRDAPPAPAPTPYRIKPGWGRVLLRAVIIALLALACYLGRPQPAGTGTPHLLDSVSFRVSGLSFSGKSDVLLGYQFTPGISGEGLSYQIIFTDHTGKSISMDAPCSGGVCSGEIILDGGHFGYTVSVCVTDGEITRSVAAAENLNFSPGQSSWTPVDPT